MSLRRLDELRDVAARIRSDPQGQVDNSGPCSRPGRRADVAHARAVVPGRDACRIVDRAGDPQQKWRDVGGREDLNAENWLQVVEQHEAPASNGDHWAVGEL